MTLQEQLNELYAVKSLIEDKLFQKYFCQPLREKQDKIHSNFFSDSLKDSWRKGGKIEGIEEFFEILKEIKHEIEDKEYQIENQDRK